MADGRVDQAVDQGQLFPLIEEMLAFDPLTKTIPQGKPFHHFVRGLVFSGKLVDFIDPWLPTGYHVGWGQLTDAEGQLLSSENDIIVYKGQRDGLRTWATECSRYSIIRSSDAEVVIQCRTEVKSISADLRKYVQEVRGFCSRVWLFAERCWAKSANRRAQIEHDAKAAGYEHFFYLYDFEQEDAITPNLPGWRDFRNAVAQLGAPVRRRKRKRKR